MGKFWPGTRLWSLLPVIAIVAFLFSLLVAEVIVRSLNIAPQVQILEFSGGVYRTTDNLELPYIPNPGHDPFNAMGFRNRDIDLELAPRQRVVVLGDSVVFGGGLPEEQVFSARLEWWLTALNPGHKVAVFNLGVPGYDTRHEIEYFKLRGLALKPTLVVLGYCLNDSYQHSSELNELLSNADYVKQASLLQQVSRTWLLRSHFIRLVMHQLNLLTGGAPPQITRVGKSRVEDALAELARLSEQHSFAVRIVVFPFLLPQADYAEKMEDHRFIRNLALENGFAFVDLLPTFRTTVGDKVDRLKIVNQDFIHINGQGHEIAARSVAPLVAEDLRRHLQ